MHHGRYCTPGCARVRLQTGMRVGGGGGQGEGRWGQRKRAALYRNWFQSILSPLYTDFRGWIAKKKRKKNQRLIRRRPKVRPTVIIIFTSFYPSRSTSARGCENRALDDFHFILPRIRTGNNTRIEKDR